MMVECGDETKADSMKQITILVLFLSRKTHVTFCRGSPLFFALPDNGTLETMGEISALFGEGGRRTRQSVLLLYSSTHLHHSFLMVSGRSLRRIASSMASRKPARFSWAPCE